MDGDEVGESILVGDAGQMDSTPPIGQSTDLDLSRFVSVLRERKWILVGLAILAVLISLLISALSTPQYQATAKVLQENATLTEALFGATVFQITNRERALMTAADLVELDEVARLVRADLQSVRSIASLKRMVEVTTEKSADIINITAKGPDAAETADVANSFARQFVAFRQKTDRQILQKARTQIEGQLAGMTPEDQASTRGLTLSQKAEELSVLESMQTGGFALAQEAAVPSGTFSPSTYLNAAIALIVGIMAGLAVILLLHVLDRRIKDEETVERQFGVPVIASVPRVGRRWSTARGKRSRTAVGFSGPGLPVLEAFRTLRSNLKFFEIDHELSTLLVTSSLPGEGKTNSAINLALSLSLSGSRVILLDADLRRPMIGQYLDLKSPLGLTNVLAGSKYISDVVQSVDTSKLVTAYSDDPRSNTVGPIAKKNLLCVASGPVPPNPSELLSSPRTNDVIEQLAKLCDYLVIDGPPLLLVSDALDLAGKVGGVIVVARLYSTKLEDAKAARESLSRVGITPLGAIVTDARKARRYYREYGGYYAGQ